MESKARLEDTIATLEARALALDSQFSESQAAIQASADECARLTAALSEVQQSLEAATQNLAAIKTRESDLEALLAEKEAQVASNLLERAQMEAERSSALERVADMESQLETQRSVASEAFKELEGTKQVSSVAVVVYLVFAAGRKRRVWDEVEYRGRERLLCQAVLSLVAADRLCCICRYLVQQQLFSSSV